MLVVDTSVLIAHLRGDQAATRLLLAGRHDDVLVPTLVAWELWKGAGTAARRAEVDALLGDLTADPLTLAIARIAGDAHTEHRRRGLERPAWDLLIAAHALHHDVPLATFDHDFAPVEGLAVVRPE